MPTVLVIDDEPLMRKMVCNTLASAGFQVADASNGVMGLKLYREQRPNLVITDILMPDKEGIETIIEIRKIDSRARIIAMSGGGRTNREDFLKIAKQFGAMEILKKPFRGDELLGAVERAFKGV
jgi:DNA-binding response OmpR family regulator